MIQKLKIGIQQYDMSLWVNNSIRNRSLWLWLRKSSLNNLVTEIRTYRKKMQFLSLISEKII
jgi:hypothetical protein